ncbi:MAG: uroporphyrinogen-III C-methyltransferase [Thiobacillaceae bacterium]
MNEISAPPRFPRINWALILAVLAMALTLWSWVDNRERARDVKTELGRRLAESDSGVKESRLLARNADEAMRQATARLGQLDAQLANSQQQQLSLEALYKELSQGRDQWTLAEIEQVLLTAAQQLQLAGNIHAAIIALESADTRLQRLNKPQFTALRRAIAADLTKLRASPQLDKIGLSAKLDALIAQQKKWPLASAHAIAARVARRPLQAANFAQELATELKSIVQIRRIGAGETTLLPPDQEYFLRENIKLRLLSARLNLLIQDQSGFHADLKAAETMLTRYFNIRDSAVNSALNELRRVGSLQIAVQAPDIQTSLTALETLKAR